jgi:hypothetical protein
MAQDDKVLKELAEIRALLTRAQKRADTQWIYSLGFAGMLGSLALLAIKAAPWQILVVFFFGLALMMIAPRIAGK